MRFFCFFLTKREIPKLNQCRKVLLCIKPTMCIFVCVCYYRSPKRLLNQTAEKGKPVPGFHHGDGPGNFFISPQIYHWGCPLALIFCSLRVQFLMQPFKNTNLQYMPDFSCKRLLLLWWTSFAENLLCMSFLSV